MVTTKNARFYQHPDIDWKSLRDFASMLQLAAGTVNHPIMDPFLQKLRVLIEELTKDTDKVCIRKLKFEKFKFLFSENFNGEAQHRLQDICRHAKCIDSKKMPLSFVFCTHPFTFSVHYYTNFLIFTLVFCHF